MRAFLGNLLNDLLSGLWFVPALIVLAAAALAFSLIEVDRTLLDGAGDEGGIVFGGTADAARDILSVVAGSLITVVAIAFSVTLVAVQQASSQYSPRLLRNFTSDRGNQVVLGVYIGTFVYSMLVMRQIRTGNDSQDSFIPALAVTVGILLAVISLGLLIYFIHHTIQSMQVTTIINRIRREVMSQVHKTFPLPISGEAKDTLGFEDLMQKYSGLFDGYAMTQVTAPTSGYLRQIDEDVLMSFSKGGARLVAVDVSTGGYVLKESEVARVWAAAPLSEEQITKARRAFTIGPDRTIRQDPLFGIRQIVDIAVKALSPGVNDPTTAEQCLAVLGDIVAGLAARDFPSPMRSSQDGMLLLVNRPSFDDFVDVSFSQIRRSSQDNTHVTCFLLKTLRDIAPRASSEKRADALRVQCFEILNRLDSSGLSESEKRLIHDSASGLLAALHRS